MGRELIAIIETNGNYTLDWIDSESQDNPLSDDIFARYKNNPVEALYLLGYQSVEDSLSDSVKYLHSIGVSYVHALLRTESLEVLREKAVVPEDNDDFRSLVDAAPYMYGVEHITEKWFSDLWRNLNKVWSSEIFAYKGKVSDYVTSKNPSMHLPGRIYFHLVENKSGDEPFAFLATYTSYEAGKQHSRHLPLKNAIEEYGGDSRKILELLGTVHKAKEKSPLIAEITESGEIFHPLRFSSAEAFTFLKEIPLYEESGIICRIPDWYTRKTNSFGVSVKVGDKKKTYLTRDSLLSFDAAITIGTDEISLEEVRRLLSEAEGLTLIKNRWVEVNHKKLSEVLNLYMKAQTMYGDKGITLADAMRIQLNETPLSAGENAAAEVGVTNGKWLTDVMTNLSRPESLPSIDTGAMFSAELRGYQRGGLNWLHYLNVTGLGACLADDMGLGKTIQAIAHINYLSGIKKKMKTLVVVPASLIGNWADEISRFAPGLKYFVIHPSEKSAESIDAGYAEKNGGVYITTYSVLSKYKWLSETEWDYMIVDEAQAIKNANTKQTKMVKSLSAGYRLALTGTPVENRLSDLWSIFDFINPGLLGSAKEFTRFTKQLGNDPEGYKRLKKIISPFILRRLKTDKTVISDLPEKIEMKSYSSLTKKQTILYASLVNSLSESLKKSGDGIKRKGLILSSIIKFKQICNHPDQYTGQHDYCESDSGKFERLREICVTIKEKRERVLVFTQFREITGHLSDFLEDIFGHKGLVIHGETAVKKRKDIVDAFQGHGYVPFMVLSLKAGGTGLNLTAANHVIHFDRWWNPAVENQATDRVFRIGQKKNVVVHKFITTGTIEERIDHMISDKSKLVSDILPDSQENWLTEMSDAEILNLVKMEM